MTKLDPSLFDEENPAEYCQGGYHPVHVNEILDNKYKVISKLGYGHYSTVWFCMDTRPNKPHTYVALKIVKSDRNYTAAADTEISHLKNSFLYIYIKNIFILF
jgi:serine/threonine-protein kinase SRPK3